MEIGNTPNWDVVRGIIVKTIEQTGISPNQLSREAGIHRSILSRFLNHKNEKLDSDSAIKIYAVLRHRINVVDRRDFLKNAGLLTLALTIGQDIITFLSYESNRKDASGEIGHMLMVLGEETAKCSWSDAVPIFLQAENLFGPASSQAAFAACKAIQLHINLGDYDFAKQEIDRVSKKYEGILDLSTEAELDRLKGWVHYYLGEYRMSEASFLHCIKIAKEAGDERLCESAYHFLGRVYRELSRTMLNRQVVDPLISKSET